MKKIISIIMTAALAFAMTNISAFAETTGGEDIAAEPSDVVTKDGLIYEIYEDGGNAVLAGTKGDLPEKLVIPDKVDDYTVTGIAEFALTNVTITSITLPDTVKEIDENALSSCYLLESADLGQVEVIGRYAFDNCTALQTVIFGDSIKRIEACAFSYCETLPYIEFPESLESIGDRAFYCCPALKEMHLPAGLEHIGDCAIGFKPTEDAMFYTGYDFPDMIVGDLNIVAEPFTFGYYYAYHYGFIYCGETTYDPYAVGTYGAYCKSLQENAANMTHPDAQYTADDEFEAEDNDLDGIIKGIPQYVKTGGIIAAIAIILIIFCKKLFKPDRRYDSRGNRMR